MTVQHTACANERTLFSFTITRCPLISFVCFLFQFRKRYFSSFLLPSRNSISFISCRFVNVHKKLFFLKNKHSSHKKVYFSSQILKRQNKVFQWFGWREWQCQFLPFAQTCCSRKLFSNNAWQRQRHNTTFQQNGRKKIAKEQQQQHTTSENFIVTLTDLYNSWHYEITDENNELIIIMMMTTTMMTVFKTMIWLLLGCLCCLHQLTKNSQLEMCVFSLLFLAATATFKWIFISLQS